MSDVVRVAPTAGTIDVTRIIPDLATAQRSLQPFDPAVLAFSEDLSRRLRKHPRVRSAPALAALAHWIRPAGIAALRRHWDGLCSVPSIVRAPRGVVFHLPPTNVDTLFVYSWLLSALVGNANVIRLSPSTLDDGGSLLETVTATITDHPTVAATTSIVSYGHDATVTGELSQSDMRVIWGGDDAVRSIRSVSLEPHATELVFPDRFSFVAFGAAAMKEVSASVVDAVVDQFVNDAYWFDQLGCSSPRLIVWVGNEDAGAIAARRFRDALVGHLGREHRSLPTSAAISKIVFAAVRSAEGSITAVDWRNNEATFVTLESLAALDRHGPGGGLFQQVRVDRLADVIDHVRRGDQTMTHWGLAEDQLATFASELGARGVERVVPVGRALEFSNHWDGHDLLHSFSRGIVVDTSAVRGPETR